MIARGRPLSSSRIDLTRTDTVPTGLTPTDLTEIGLTSTDLTEIGLTPTDLIDIGLTPTDLIRTARVSGHRQRRFRPASRHGQYPCQ